LNYCKIKSGDIVPCYGITKFPDDGNYAMVLIHLPEGNLRNYLGHAATKPDKVNIGITKNFRDQSLVIFNAIIINSFIMTHFIFWLI